MKSFVTSTTTEESAPYVSTLKSATIGGVFAASTARYSGVPSSAIASYETARR